MPTTIGLYTTVRNTSGRARSFGFLGKHGRRLAAGETYTEPGDLAQKAARRGVRHFKGLERSLLAGRLAIVVGPAPTVRDATTGDAKVLTLVNGVLGIGDPSWGVFEGVLRGSFAAPTTPRVTPVATIVLSFGVPVTGFVVGSLVLTRAAVPVTLAGVTASTADSKAFTIGDMTALTGVAGAYVLTLPAAGSAVVDIDGNTQATDIVASWTHS